MCQRQGRPVVFVPRGQCPGTIIVLLEDRPSLEKNNQILQVPLGAKLMKTDRVVSKGTSFEKNDGILLNDGVDNDELPSFGTTQGRDETDSLQSCKNRVL